MYVKRSIAGCFKATTANISACTVVTLYDRSCIGTAVKLRKQGTPLAIRPKIMARLVEAEAWGEKYYYQQSSQYLSICNNYTLISICNT